MRLDNFKLEKYDKYSYIHKKVIEEIEGNYFLGNLEMHVDMVSRRKEEDYSHNDIYIAFYGDDDYGYRPVGFISLNHKEFGYEVVSGLLPEERGYHLGPMLLQEFSEKIFEVKSDIDELVLKINSKNHSGIRSALLAGYEKVDDECYVMRRGSTKKR